MEETQKKRTVEEWVTAETIRYLSDSFSCIFGIGTKEEYVQRLKEAKRAEWKSSHSGHTPTEEQLMATISPGELKRHCRGGPVRVEERCGRAMISQAAEIQCGSCTDTTGLAGWHYSEDRHYRALAQKEIDEKIVVLFSAEAEEEPDDTISMTDPQVILQVCGEVGHPST
ncbi:unnamed protein product [Arctogadus glacialis]